MLRTEYQTRNTRTSYEYFIFTHTLSSFYILPVRTKYASISRGQKNIFNLHQLVMQNKALMFYYLSKI